MQVFETPGSVSLQVRLPSGSVVVTTVDEPRTSVELIAKGRRGPDAIEDVVVRADERHGGHTITIEQKDKFRWGPIQISWGGDIEVRVTCPPGSDLELAGGSTDLRVEGELGEVSARSASGDLRLDTVRNKLQAKTASGDITVGAIESDASVVTVSGDLGIRRVDATLTARSVSGDVRISALRAPLTLSTTSGDVNLESVEAGEVRLQTVSGDVRIGVGRGTRVWIDATSVSGDLGSEIGLADQLPGEPSTEEQEGDVVPLQVRTVSGDVAIVRAAAALA
ncbi:MAG: DUF4097 family beta strand repeat-containing protein [Gaiellaceae bacterium]